MTSLCSRIGCSGSAVATFAFDGRAGIVWLDLVEDGPRIGEWGAGVLCRAHADTLTPPRGWQLQDRRVPAPRLWTDRGGAVVHTPARVRHRRRGAEEPVSDPQPLPFGATTAVSAAVEPSAQWPELGRVLDARTPLLARAFEAARVSRA
jgi:uncharacterized protein DUF3499